jgi:excinuclease UvrABC ATPase subunit
VAKITIDIIRETLATENWNVLSQEYKNLTTEMEFMCPEGHKVFTTWEKLRRRRECPTCNQNKLKSTNFKVTPKKKDVYRILALDQSTHLTGWSIYDGDSLIAYGIYETTTTAQIERMNEVKEWLLSMIVNWRPDFIGLEGI